MTCLKIDWTKQWKSPGRIAVNSLSIQTGYLLNTVKSIVTTLEYSVPQCKYGRLHLLNNPIINNNSHVLVVNWYCLGIWKFKQMCFTMLFVLLKSCEFWRKHCRYVIAVVCASYSWNRRRVLLKYFFTIQDWWLWVQNSINTTSVYTALLSIPGS
jgi:hypothetical protein